MHYFSDDRRARAVVSWMEGIEGDPGHWNTQTQLFKFYEAKHKYNVKLMMSRFNQTGGFHFYQNMFGCELNDDGSNWGFSQFGYDGKEFISLDRDKGIYVPIMKEAQITAQRWNSIEDGQTERYKIYLETRCLEDLKKYISSGIMELQRKVPPQVKVSGHQSEEVTKLHCLAYGFYPRDVHVKWVKNGIDDVYSERAKEILPNPDGTYQIRVIVEVTPKKGDSYSCHVDHSSLEEALVVLWDSPKHNTLPIVIGVIVVTVVVATGIGFVVYKKRSGNRTYGPASSAEVS